MLSLYCQVYVENSEPLVPCKMENAESGHLRILSLSSTGRAREEWPRLLGDYSLNVVRTMSLVRL